MNSIDSLVSAFDLDPGQGLTSISADQLAMAYFPPLNPDLGALVIDLPSSKTTERALAVLRELFPNDHRVLLYRESGRAVLDLALEELDPDTEALALYLPPLRTRSSFAALQNTVALLRAPEGCPWDREQTHQSLRKHLLEEAYETLEAIDQADQQGLREELGDLLLQILMHARISQEAGHFTMSDVVSSIQAKLIRRHPHVFGDLEVSDVDQVLDNWEHYKNEERDGGPLDGVPGSLPALAQAAELQDRAGRVGFEWPTAQQALDQVKDDCLELGVDGEQRLQAEELGRMLFAIVNYARRVKMDPEAELQRANQEFRSQFSNLLQSVSDAGQRLKDLDLTTMMQLWDASRAASE